MAVRGQVDPAIHNNPQNIGIVAPTFDNTQQAGIEAPRHDQENIGIVAAV